jgi:hypothetical protein
MAGRGVRGAPPAVIPIRFFAKKVLISFNTVLKVLGAEIPNSGAGLQRFWGMKTR